MTKLVQNLDMLRNFEHVMKLDETCKSLIVINQDSTKNENFNWADYNRGYARVASIENMF